MTYTVHTRDEWADFPVRQKSWKVYPAHAVVVHHSASDSLVGTDGGADFIRWLYNYGMRRDGAGTEYNDILVGEDQWWEGFGPTVPGAHCLGIDPQTGDKASLSCYGVCVWGNYVGRAPSETQVQSLIRFLQQRIAEGHIVEHPKVYGHRDLAQTACPGDQLYVRLPEVEEALRGGVVPFVPSPEPAPAPAPAPTPTGGDDMAYVIYESVDEAGTRWAWADFLGLEAGGLCEYIVWIDGDYKAAIEQSGAAIEHKRRAQGGYKTMRLEAGLPQGDQQYQWSDQPGVDFRRVT